MKFVDEYRNPEILRVLASKIKDLRCGHVKIMEVCGSQTHTILKYNIEELLPPGLDLIHGPGCPVCVTPPEMIDAAVELAGRRNFIVVTYGDMLRVPGSGCSLLQARSDGADIRIIHSPLDGVRIAESLPDKKVIFLAVGFETTAPGNASAVLYAAEKNVSNYFIISSQVLIPPAVKYILSSGSIEINGLLAPGHVCTVTGYKWCQDISKEYKIPVTVTGFEPSDILEGIYLTALNASSSNHQTINQYKRIVKENGNAAALERMYMVFEPCDMHWRGLGLIPGGGLKLHNTYSRFNALDVFGIQLNSADDESECISGEILQGIKKPSDCSLFASVCRPDNPVGAAMVSSEGACAAYYKYKSSKAPAV